MSVLDNTVQKCVHGGKQLFMCPKKGQAAPMGHAVTNVNTVWALVCMLSRGESCNHGPTLLL